MKINNLNVEKSGTPILKNLNAQFEAGLIHIIMGANGSGKSTLSNTIAGHPDCVVTSGEIMYDNHDLIPMEVHERAIEGIYLSPQYPPVIEGLSHAALLKESLNVRKEARGEEAVDDFQFLKALRLIAEKYNFDPKLYPKQSLNSGFSGGEKKRNEILQIDLLSPNFIILDEIDSGLDIEAMKSIAQFIKQYITPERTILVITHYTQFAQLVGGDKIHVMKNGSIVTTGSNDILTEIETNGFGVF
jgi:Fe-S cluster assembly ATP-binding protein